MEPKLTFYEHSHRGATFTHVVVATCFEGKWLWVKHRERDTWELPAGHIELGETPCVAAMRELYEETGILNYKINLICDFEVDHKGKSSYNRLYLAIVNKLGFLPVSEIEEVKLFDSIPQNLTYPSIQSMLWKKASQTIAGTV